MIHRPMFRSLSLMFVAVLALAGAALQAGRPAAALPPLPPDSDEEILRFSTVGDSRQDDVAPDPTLVPLSGQDAIWLQSTKAWSRIIDEIHMHRSQLLFFNGDMIMGYGKASAPAAADIPTVVGSDLMKFYRQYAFWRGMVAGLMEKGTYVVPVAGNHETQSKPLGKKAQVENENAWRANMGDLILDTARFTNLFGETPTFTDVSDNKAFDGLTTPQNQLSYSFDFRGLHFAVINTDPVGADATAPTNWLKADLDAAAARGTKRSFVFGHKPAFTYYYGSVIPAPPALPLPGKPSGLDQTSPNLIPQRDAFWHEIEAHNAIYFCGHEHIFNLMQPLGGAWQIMVGSGGSPFEAAPTAATLNPGTDRDYAWATVRVLRSGKVLLTAYGFDDHFGHTRILKSILIH